MKDLKSSRKYEELSRIISRTQKLYDGIIINEDGEDSFQSPKELILNFFRCSYEFKENLKIEFPQLKQKIEDEIKESKWIAVVIDGANQEKHGKLKSPKTEKSIGEINTNIQIFDPNGKKDRTEMSIKIDDNKVDCLSLLKNTKIERDIFLKKNSISL